MPQPDFIYADATCELPEEISLLVGKIIVQCAYLENGLSALIAKLLRISDIEARLTLKEIQLQDRSDTIRNLMFLKDIQTDFNFSEFRKSLNEIRMERNSIAHGIWVLVPNSRIPHDLGADKEDLQSLRVNDHTIFLGLTNGERADKARIAETRFHSRKIFPEGLAYGKSSCTAFLAKIKSVLDIAENLESTIDAWLKASPQK